MLFFQPSGFFLFLQRPASTPEESSSTSSPILRERKCVIQIISVRVSLCVSVQPLACTSVWVCTCVLYGCVVERKELNSKHAPCKILHYTHVHQCVHINNDNTFISRFRFTRRITMLVTFRCTVSIKRIWERRGTNRMHTLT